MENIFLVLYFLFFGLGVLVALVSYLWLLILAFQEHILWGLGCLFIQIVIFVFVIMYWGKTWKPFLIHIASVVYLLFLLVVMLFMGN